MEHSGKLSPFIKLPFVIKTFVLSFLSGLFTKVELYFAKTLIACLKLVSHWDASNVRLFQD